MECKYKFHKPEHFDGKPYCTLFDKLCEKCFVELGYSVCEENCQVYEDQKKLEKIKELFDRTCKCKHLVLDECSLTGKNCIGIKECLYKYQLTLIEIRKIALESCLCCGECKSEFSTKSYCDFNEIIQKANEVLNG